MLSLAPLHPRSLLRKLPSVPSPARLRAAARVTCTTNSGGSKLGKPWPKSTQESPSILAGRSRDRAVDRGRSSGSHSEDWNPFGRASVTKV